MTRTILALFAVTAAGVALAQGAPADFVYENAAMGNTTFSHSTHIAKGKGCPDCHTDPFQMKKGATKITMAEINAGKQCGKCHNGTDAFAATDCAKCHKK